MSLPEGVLSVAVTTLSELCRVPPLPESTSVGIRWKSGEVVDRVLLVDTDIYSVVEQVEYEGEVYSLEFDHELIDWALAWPENRKRGAVALRYAIEFDAPYDPSNLGIGGKHVWGGGRSMPVKRTPEEFQRSWGLA